MTTENSRSAVRVCAIADIQCSRGCGTGACKREQTTDNSRADALTPEEIQDRLHRFNSKRNTTALTVVSVTEFIIELLAASPVEQPAAAPIDGTRERIAKALHYPDCWDTAAYPTLDTAVLESLNSFLCSECVAKLPAPSPADERAALFREAIAWGRAYGDAIPATQWNEMREQKVAQLAARAASASVTRERDDPAIIAAANRAYATGLSDGKTLGALAAANETGAEAHKLLAALIDIYDDERNNAPEDRCYVEGAWTETINEARAFLVFYPSAAPQSPAQADARVGLTDELRAEIDRLNAIINTPQAGDFLRAVSIEAEHQRQRWGSEHDAGKQPADWFWLIGYLAGKALHASAAGDVVKAEHHVITTAAALANWHGAMLGKNNMRPGIDGDALLQGTNQ